MSNVENKGKKCAADGCEEAATAKYLCIRHYSAQIRELERQAKGQSPRSKNQGKTCRTDGCEKPAEKKMMCNNCYRRHGRKVDPKIAKRVLLAGRRATEAFSVSPITSPMKLTPADVLVVELSLDTVSSLGAPHWRISLNNLAAESQIHTWEYDIDYEVVRVTITKDSYIAEMFSHLSKNQETIPTGTFAKDRLNGNIKNPLERNVYQQDNYAKHIEWLEKNKRREEESAL